MNKFNLTHTGEELDEAAAIFASGVESDVSAFDVYVCDLADPTGFSISHGAADSVIGAIVSG